MTTREQKIEALIKDKDKPEVYKAFILAGIALRDEELLAIEQAKINCTSVWVKSPAPEGEKE
jgi:hypothetical protein